MTKSAQFDLEKIEQLLATATNPRQKAMYQDLLEKAQQQKAPKPSAPVGEAPIAETKKKRKKKQKDDSQPLTSEKKAPQVISLTEQPTEKKPDVTPVVSSDNQPPSKSVETENKKATEDKSDNSPIAEKVIAKTEAVVTESREITESKKDESQIVSSDNKESFTPDSKDEAVSEQETGEEFAQIYPETMFQAVGVITGQVKFDEEGKSTVTVGRKEYPLSRGKHRCMDALKKEIENTGEDTYQLIVYPKVIHFPKKEQNHRVFFQLVGFNVGRQESGVSDDLNDMEFKLLGLWQFIPVCRTPCISIFRNFTKDRLQYIKEVEPARKVRFMKAAHLPLLWKDAPVRPFRFNPKAGKEEDQGKPFFVQVKARFMPGRDVFGFVEQLEEPLQKAPKFLKASKKDKTEAQKGKAEAQKEQVKPHQKPVKPQKKEKKDGKEIIAAVSTAETSIKAEKSEPDQKAS